MEARVEEYGSKKAVLLIPQSAEEWQILASLKHINPMLPAVGSALFLTTAPYTEPDADSPKVRASGSVLRMPDPSH